MRKLNGFIVTCALLLMFSTASAQVSIVIDNQIIPNSDIDSITILPGTNVISIITTVPYVVEPDEGGPPAPGAVTLSLSASPSTIIEGGSTTISWVTQNASSCTPSGGTGGWDSTTITLANGNTSITIPTVSTNVFTLTCQGLVAGDSIVRNRTVVANAEPEPSACTTPALASGSTIDWQSFFLVNFPGPGYENRNLTVPRNGYIALRFNTGNINDDGKISLLETTATTGQRIGTFSECPGDFDESNQCSYTWGLGGGLRWATNNRSGACQLDANTDYYFNVTFTDGVNSSSSNCSGNTCRVVVQHVNQ